MSTLWYFTWLCAFPCISLLRLSFWCALVQIFLGQQPVVIVHEPEAGR